MAQAAIDQRTLLPRSARVDDMCHSAAKDRTFKIVRPNQGTCSGRCRRLIQPRQVGAQIVASGWVYGP